MLLMKGPFFLVAWHQHLRRQTDVQDISCEVAKPMKQSGLCCLFQLHMILVSGLWRRVLSPTEHCSCSCSQKAAIATPPLLVANTKYNITRWTRDIT
ncbi:hypothetical protein DUNSADRAFT_12786 [Dunaliella salina]|uniref:Encoded protein n=1 Tax=Dunaliella salina TaxID=3046 RepID=A0ABQ7GAJ1_DUNSA|nr:hypothetical protein DUNSADRAFT_12786 [Dunaliella salina]|eukprot:KAF5831627.1 hypothetical protein DUNSADRAFT_12786 [Dunaliella salina]